MKEKLGFGTGDLEDLFHRFKDKYVVISPSFSGDNYGGFLKDEFDGFFVLNPHLGKAYTKEGSIVKLIEKDEYVRESSIQAIRETTRESLESYGEVGSRNTKQEDRKQEK